MKKTLLATTLTGVLLLGACGNEEVEKTHENKTESVEKKKEALKKNTSKQEEVTQQQPKQVEQQEEDVPELNPEKNFDPHGGEVPNEGYSNEELKELEGEPTEQEKMEANAKVAKEHGFTGIPNGDMGSTEEMEAWLKEQEAKEEMEEEESSEWVKGQDEWNNASESERVEMQKESARENGVEYDPKDFEVE